MEMTIEQKRAMALASARLRAEGAPQTVSQPNPVIAAQIDNDAISRGARAEIAANPLTMANEALKYTSLGGLAGKLNQAMQKQVEEGGYAAGGRTADALSGMGASPEVSAGVGAAVNAGINAIPMVVGGITGRAVGQSAGTSLMRSALKPGSDANKSGDAMRAVRTLLEEGHNVTQGGVRGMQSKIDALDDVVSKAIRNSTASIDRNVVAAKLQPLIDDLYLANQQGSIPAVEKAYQNFMTNPMWGRDIPVQLAQEIKRAIQKSVGDRGYKIASSVLDDAALSADKTLATGLREQIAAAVPAVEKPNARMSRLINARKLTEHRVGVAGNKDPLALALLTQDPKAGAAFLANRSELLKSMLARMLYRGGAPAGVAAGSGVALNDQPE